ncbi:hypothetical protein M8C21_018332 [Ambrosia artemisiifolia]|uniref:Dolichyl-diphosphooligosaccharide--protein glycosyltransferase subunit KCP2 n=1 Tax=Ambrosia artemisiifolia TaxID=4212 RepID=A0AAD5BV36_AMBAR|nr:hypothetical protein M8C21_018332 [Ambrosia artemisiifolia]
MGQSGLGSKEWIGLGIAIASATNHSLLLHLHCRGFIKPEIQQHQIHLFHKPMAEPGNSMLYSLLLFVVTLSLQQMYRGKLASSELFTILGGFISSLVFLFLFTFIGNYQETSGVKTGWGAVILAEAVALVAAGTVHRL